ncbi:hypothetical protein EJ110_NYTH44782 [Nymphaea thermarum]|nr:hypothetical protein EJ110_NYTH44782 [Nymphaea thermarum]
MWFHYILADWEGTTTDVRVLYNALEYNIHPLEILHGKYYLNDVEYPNIVGLLSPCRYHLLEFNVSESKQIEKKKNCTTIDVHSCALLCYLGAARCVDAMRVRIRVRVRPRFLPKPHQIQTKFV